MPEIISEFDLSYARARRRYAAERVAIAGDCCCVHLSVFVENGQARCLACGGDVPPGLTAEDRARLAFLKFLVRSGRRAS